MKYLYLDCFAGFDPLMLLGAFVDMGIDAESLQKSFLPGVTLSTFCEKRMGMEAVLAKADSKHPSRLGDAKDLEEMAECIGSKKELLNSLKSYISIRSSALSLDPSQAVFDIRDESVNISALFSALETINAWGVERVYVSTVFAPDGRGLFDPYTKEDTMYISKKYGIKTRPANEECEIFPASGAAFLAALGAQSRDDFIPGGVIKIGYGAGHQELFSLPNVLRVVLGEESDTDHLSSDKACISENIFTEFAATSMKER